MSEVLKSQARLQYSLLRLAVRVAARFQIPMRTLSELMRMAYYAELRKEGLPHNEIARRMDQTDRNVRYYALRHRGNFFEKELDPGLLRSVEHWVAVRSPTPVELRALVPKANDRSLGVVLKNLVDEGRIILREDNHYVSGPSSHGLLDEGFEEKLETVEPSFDALYHAVLNRLVYDNSVGARIQSITFRAPQAAVEPLLTRFEARLREGLAELQRQAELSGEGRNYAINLTIAPTPKA